MKPVVNPYLKRQHQVAVAVDDAIRSAVVVPVDDQPPTNLNTPSKKKQKIEEIATTTHDTTGKCVSINNGQQQIVPTLRSSEGETMKTSNRRSPRLISPEKFNELKPIAIGLTPTKKNIVSDSHIAASTSSNGTDKSDLAKKGKNTRIPKNVKDERKSLINGDFHYLINSNQMKKTLLGRLRTRDGIQFAWMQPPFSFENFNIGRVYFPGFTIRNDNNSSPSTSYCVDDIVLVTTSNIPQPQTVRIVSVYQATKSYMGDAYSDDYLQEIQKRGHPYMEVQLLDKSSSEVLTDWLLDASLKMKKINCQGRTGICPVEMSKKWHPKLQAKQVHFYNTKKAKRCPPNVQQIYNNEDSDSSCCSSDDNSLDAFRAPQHNRLETNYDFSLRENDSISGNDAFKSKTTDDETSEMVDNDSYDRISGSTSIKPMPQLVAHQDYSFFETPAIRCSTNSADDIAKRIRCGGFGDDIANEIKRKLENQLTYSFTTDVVLVDEEQNVVCNKVDELKQIIAKFYPFDLHTSQYMVCMELLKGRHYLSQGKMRYDVFFAAPCGFGKSLCFVAVAYALKGITLVVEPLRALISSQVSELKERKINVERLLPADEASDPGKLHAYDYLQHLINSYNRENPLIIFCTPEILCKCTCENGLIQSLVEKNMMSLVVVDEFDYIDECYEQYRNEYTTIVPKLKQSVKGSNIPFLYLSATGSSNRMKNVLQAQPSNTLVKPILFQVSQILPKNHIYKVERKVSLEQSVQRMVSIVHDTSRMLKTSLFPRCICFCLTHINCMKAVEELNKCGVQAAVFSSVSDKNSALLGFHNGTIRVLCATSALGRGVNIRVPIRFIFHLFVPASLTEYIQATGRGGRDGDTCHCVLFFRPQDIQQVKNVIKFEDRNADDRERCCISIGNVHKFVFEGQQCRKQMLAHDTLSFLNENGIPHNFTTCRESVFCDNCLSQRAQQGNCKINITNLVTKLLRREVVHERLDVQTMKKLAIDLRNEQKELIQQLIISPPRKSSIQFSLLNDLCRFIEIHDRNSFVKRLLDGTVSMYLQYSALEKISFKRDKAWFNYERIEIPQHYTNIGVLSCVNYPYVLCFEGERLGLDVHEAFVDRLPAKLSTACEDFFARKKLKPALYFNDLRFVEKKNLPVSNILTFQAELQEDSTLILREPVRAADRRIFRMYGSDRFLEISFSAKVTNQTIKSFLSNDVIVGNRRFKFFSLKREDGIKAVLFAESGPDLENTSILTVRERCIPSAVNPELTLGKWVKRMKLSFSTTTAGCKLPPKSVSILDDFSKKGIAEIDGAGLISLEALETLFEAYKKNSHAMNNDSSEICNYSGFQGRLAGFKGVWILDPTLQGFKVKCRKSQLKYNVPMKCREECTAGCNDEAHETIEISSFCKKQATTLNTRVIQILEYYAERAQKGDELLNFLFQCVDETVQDIPLIAAGNHEALFQTLKKVNIRIDEDDSFDSIILSRMVAANVDIEDPEATRRCKRLLEKFFGLIRDKAHYTLSHCIDLRLYPDHTLLLLENEAFMSIDGNEINAEEVLVMRSPSFFPGDMRRLKLVKKQTLLNRSIEQKQHLGITFFNSVRNALVTSIHGSAAEAARLSGGDYDGDRAWITWNQALLNCLPAAEEFIEEDTSTLTTPTSYLETKLWSDCSENDILDYMIHFRNHHRVLGRLSELLDSYIDLYGFEDSRTKEIGRAAFLQVDMPYHPYQINEEILNPNDMYKCPSPDWKGKFKPYQSKSVLGKLYRKMNEILDSALSKNKVSLQPKMSSLIPTQIRNELISHCIDKNDLKKMRDESKEYVKKYIQDKQLYAHQNLSSSNDVVDIIEYSEWKKRYFLKDRENFIFNKILDPDRVTPLQTAVLYEQCYVLEANDASCKACEYVWGVCFKELIEIFAGRNPITVAIQAQSYCLRR